MAVETLQKADERALYRAAVQAVREKCALLDASSPITGPLNRAIEAAESRLDGRTARDLEWDSWRPPLFALVDILTADELMAFDADCRRVAERSIAIGNHGFRWLNEDSPGKWNEWHGQLFDLSLKARLLDASATVGFDEDVTSGRNVDVTINLSDRPVRLEATAHCDSDEQKGIERRWMAKKKSDPELVLEQPGRFDPTDEAGRPIGREPLPAYDCVRVYAKVYEKIAKNLDPDAAQFDGTCPTVLAINLPRGGNKARRGMEMAIEELFSKGRGGAGPFEPPAARIDDSLAGWLDHYAVELLRKGKLRWDEYTQSRTRLLTAPAKISAIAVFERYAFSFSRINYNALPACMPTHVEMAALDQLLSNPPPIWTRRMMVGPE